MHSSILNAIPHRPPFLFVDKIIEKTNEYILVARTLKAEEAFFRGHYPNNPIMPGVLICESVFQAAAIYLVHKMKKEGQEFANKTPVLARIEEARFRRIVKPGETMLIQANWKESMGQFHFLKGTVKVDEQLAATLSFALAMIDEPA